MKAPTIFNIRQRPYQVLGIMGLLAFSISLIPANAASVDVNLHDTYFVIDCASLWRFLSALLLFEWEISAALKGHISNKLCWFQILFTGLPLLFFIKGAILPMSLNDLAPRDYAFDEFNQHGFNNAEIWYLSILLLCVLSQLLFLINIGLGLFRILSGSKSNGS